MGLQIRRESFDTPLPENARRLKKGC